MSGFLDRLWAALGKHQPAPPTPQPAAVPVLAVGEAPATLHGIPPAAVDMVAHFEGFRPDAYLCPASVWTIGYGTTRIDGRPVRASMRVSEAEARRLLAADLADAAQAVDALVDVPLAQHEFGALVSWTHNLGRGNLARSTLLRKLNAGQKDGAAAEFLRWDKANGVTLRGLTRRRAAEAAMFSGGDWRKAAGL